MHRLHSQLLVALAVQQASTQYLDTVPEEYGGTSVVLIEDNLAVLPGEWVYETQMQPFYNVTSDDEDFQSAADTIASADFIAFSPDLLPLLGPSATLERIVNFTGPESELVHEAPAYVPDTNELFFSTTTAIGRLWALNLDTLELRNVTLDPPLSNINGATYHNGKVYVCTNGSPVRGIYSVDINTGATTAVVNNYRGRRLNSPNDVIFDSQGNMWFTDPNYGWWSEFDGVDEPELPQSIYFFNMTSKALQAVSNDVVHVPNGLAFSPNEKKLYVADSATLQGRPLGDVDLSGLRNVVAFDVAEYPLLSNPRLVHETEVGWPDGIRTTSSGHIIVGVLEAADIVNPYTGTLLGKINCPGDIIYNVERVAGTGTWLLAGAKHIYRVSIAETSPPLPGKVVS